MMKDYRPYIWQESTSSYREIKPAVGLRHGIDCYWLSYPLENVKESRIIPDLCADIIMAFDHDGELTSTVFNGANSHYFISPTFQSQLLIGIRFYLTALPRFFKANLSGTKNQLVMESDDLQRFTDGFQETYRPPFSVLKVIEQLDHYFLKELLTSQSDSKLALVQSVIHNSLNTNDYQALVAQEILSERTIQRYFRQLTGLSPYEVFEVIRFQKVLHRLTYDKTVSHLDLVYDYGFYDQAHYARSLKKISGLSPVQIATHCRNCPSQAPPFTLN